MEIEGRLREIREEIEGDERVRNVVTNGKVVL